MTVNPKPWVAAPAVMTRLPPWRRVSRAVIVEAAKNPVVIAARESPAVTGAASRPCWVSRL
jgi:hypothetical protein